MSKLQEIREARGLSISELARMSSVSRPTIYKLERGDLDEVRTRTLKALADALDVKITDFF